MDKKKVKELMEQILKYCDQCYNPNWQPKSFEEFVKLGNICREAIKELSKSDWVSVENGLPEYMEKVWVTDKEHRDFVWISHRENGDTPKRLDDNGFPAWQHHYPYYHITHWRKIDKLEE